MIDGVELSDEAARIYAAWAEYKTCDRELDDATWKLGVYDRSLQGYHYTPEQQRTIDQLREKTRLARNTLERLAGIEVSDRRIDDLGLPARAENALARGGVTREWELRIVTALHQAGEWDTRTLGPKSWSEIYNALGLSVGDGPRKPRYTRERLPRTVRVALTAYRFAVEHESDIDGAASALAQLMDESFF